MDSTILSQDFISQAVHVSETGSVLTGRGLDTHINDISTSTTNININKENVAVLENGLFEKRPFQKRHELWHSMGGESADGMGFLQKNPFPYKTETEWACEFELKPVYRLLLQCRNFKE